MGERARAYLYRAGQVSENVFSGKQRLCVCVGREALLPFAFALCALVCFISALRTLHIFRFVFVLVCVCVYKRNTAIKKGKQQQEVEIRHSRKVKIC